MKTPEVFMHCIFITIPGINLKYDTITHWKYMAH